MNSPSSHAAEGGISRLASLASTSSSMKLRRDDLAKVSTRTALSIGAVSIGTVIEAVVTLLRYQAVTAPSPYPTVFATPSGETCTADSLAELNSVQRVTSSTRP